MQVILLERVNKLGQMGQIVTVKDGFARNFLLPQKKALRATASNKAAFEVDRASLEADNLQRKSEAETVAATMAAVNVVMIRAAGESGQLYGSVSSRDIAEAVIDAGIKITRTQVVLDRAIKNLGLHDVIIKLHAEVAQVVTVNIARSEDEAKTQFETGTAVNANVYDDSADEEEFVEEPAEDGSADVEAASTDAEEATEEAAKE